MTSLSNSAADSDSPAGTETASGIAAAVRQGSLTARQAVDRALGRIEHADAQIGAYQVVRVEAARTEADAVDARSDREQLPLAGVPMAIKDNVPVTGEPMRTGSAGSDPAPRARDHEIVRRLRDAGAVVVGITRVPELCVYGTTDSTYGTTRNPWNLTLSPGGSSGGSAAAVASGTVPVAHGNDGMGSIRIPAACCGLVGIKPGLGVVPADLGNGSWFDMAENGPLTTTVADAALVLSVMAGDPTLATPVAPGALRIALSTRVPGFTPLDSQWKAAATSSAEILRAAGHSVTTAHPAYDLRLTATEFGRWAAGTALDIEQLVEPEKIEPRVRRHAKIGRVLKKLGLAGESGRTAWQARAEKLFADHDVLLTPMLAQSPRSSTRWSERGWAANIGSNAYYAPFAAPWNVAGWPAMSVPAGTSRSGQPLAVQLVGRPGSEATLLGLAAQLETAHPWVRVAPAFAH